MSMALSGVVNGKLPTPLAEEYEPQRFGGPWGAVCSGPNTDPGARAHNGCVTRQKFSGTEANWGGLRTEHRNRE